MILTCTQVIAVYELALFILCRAPLVWTAEQLEQAYERRLVQDGVDSLARGKGIEVTSEYFNKLRQLARDTAAKRK